MIGVGVTGGIGSGKSTVCRIFRTLLGIPVYDSDANARRITDEDPEIISQIINLFGKEAYTQSGTGFEGTIILDRRFVAGRVFDDPALLGALNGIIHPAVEADFNEWAAGQQDAPYVIQEAAILFESGAAEKLDAVIAVVAPLELRVERVMDRDGLTEEEVHRRMANQIYEDELLARADYVIIADGNRPLVPQILEIDKKLTSRCI